MSTERVAIFIDGSNLYHSVKGTFQIHDNQMNFANLIEILRNKKIRKSDGTYEFAVKGDDIHLATDMLSFAYENVYDTAILVSGDGDFVPAIKKIQKMGKKVENAYFSVSRSDFLRDVCNSSILLDEIVKNVMKK
ncbi:MAG: NYN domain-containing protein [Candidatus Aenigmarchaeota archaeon]|nr:NYN domain-containing protein [Candidatus Aenigmarchaeota archaeon]